MAVKDTEQNTEQNTEQDTDEICREFARLTRIDAPSFGEREMADYLKGRLLELGFSVSEDGAGERIGGSAGNLYGFLKGTMPGAPVLLCAHMDTVEPSRGKKAVFLEDGTITSGGDTVLGADDAAGLVQILHGIGRVLRRGVPRRDVEVLFPAAEEVYTRGSRAFDGKKLKAGEAYVLDLSGPVGTAAWGAPSLLSFAITVKGRAAHAGFEPEKGIHAIAAAARALAGLAQGRLDEDTTLNIGTIQGGLASNIVPESCTLTGEIRSMSHERALNLAGEVRDVFERACREAGAACEMKTEVHLRAYETALRSLAVRHFQAACRELGLPGNLVKTFGGSDNNTLAEYGIPGLVLSCGMYRAHSVKEYTTRQDLELGARLIARLITEEAE